MAGDFDIGPADYEADMSDNGKGDSPRPIAVDSETFKKNWEQTFAEPVSPDGICDACMDEEPNLRRIALPRTLDSVSEMVDVWLCKDCYWIEPGTETLGNPEE